MKIALGTVQFGMNYGVSNHLGQVERCEVGKILQYAFKKGIDVLDTAAYYGNSESLIGDFMSSYSSNEYWNVITKTPAFKSNIIGNREIDELLKSFELSQKRTGKKVIHGLLIHNCDNLFIPGGEKLLHAMNQLKRDGVIKKIGVSLYTGDQVDRILDYCLIDLIQLPINILDQRLIKGGQLNKLKRRNVEIHARSVFLQGLLLMPLKDLSSWFEPIQGALKRFHLEAKRRNMSTLELSLGFVQSIPEIDKIVVGVNTSEQLHEIIDVASTYVNIKELSDLSISNPDFLNPSNWKI